MTLPTQFHVFLSAVSSEFRQERMQLENWLERKGLHVSSQEKFNQGGSTLWQKLHDEVDRVDSKLTCPGYVAHDLSGSSFRVFQPRAEIVARTVGLGWTIGGTSDPWVGPSRRGWARPVSMSWPSAS